MALSHPLISYGNSCATEFEMEGRLDSGFRNNVYLNNTIIALTVVMTHKVGEGCLLKAINRFQAVMKMMKKNMFGKTTRNLFFFCMLYYIIHDIYFALTLVISHFPTFPAIQTLPELVILPVNHPVQQLLQDHVPRRRMLLFVRLRHISTNSPALFPVRCDSWTVF